MRWEIVNYSKCVPTTLFTFSTVQSTCYCGSRHLKRLPTELRPSLEVAAVYLQTTSRSEHKRPWSEEKHVNRIKSGRGSLDNFTFLGSSFKLSRFSWSSAQRRSFSRNSLFPDSQPSCLLEDLSVFAASSNVISVDLSFQTPASSLTFPAIDSNQGSEMLLLPLSACIYRIEINFLAKAVR